MEPTHTTRPQLAIEFLLIHVGKAPEHLEELRRRQLLRREEQQSSKLIPREEKAGWLLTSNLINLQLYIFAKKNNDSKTLDSAELMWKQANHAPQSLRWHFETRGPNI
jgi:hypothetical protein